MADPLEALLVDEAGLARDELASVLEPYVRFGRDGGLWPSDGFDLLNSRRKVLCLVLAAKAQHLLGLRTSDRVSPGELVSMSNMAAGTVRPKLSELVNADRLLAKDREGYFVPDAVARRAAKALGGAS